MQIFKNLKLKDIVQIYKLGLSSKQYQTYEKALKYSGNNGYEEDELCHFLIEKTKIYIKNKKYTEKRQEHIILSEEIKKIQSQKKITVLDFGGMCGHHYFAIKYLLPKKINLKYIISETPTLAKKSEKIFSNEELKFIYDLNKLKHVDVVFSSGALQSTDKPEKYLNKLIELKPKIMIFNKLDLVMDKKNHIHIQNTTLYENGPSDLIPKNIKNKLIKYPYTRLREKTFYETVLKKYEIKSEIKHEARSLLGHKRILKTIVLKLK